MAGLDGLAPPPPNRNSYNDNMAYEVTMFIVYKQGTST